MIWPALVCSIGLPAGFVLIRRVPLCPETETSKVAAISVVVPARNEERNLPRLLISMPEAELKPAELIVVDDASSDTTSKIAHGGGARVIPSADLPLGWTGKVWACHQGARVAQNPLLLFLDADTYFQPGGGKRLRALHSQQGTTESAVSVLPYHVMLRPYEQLSLFFNLLMASGAGGFGVAGKPKLFGQSLLISQCVYKAVGGHGAVRGNILENLRLASLVHAAGFRTVCCGGRGTLHMRMYPDGFAHMCEGWAKAFTHGARDSGPMVIGFAILWISSLFSTFFLLIVPFNYGRVLFGLLYLIYSLQLFWMARQLGTYRWTTCALYPIPLAFYCAIFARSLVRSLFGRRIFWRGREI
jgi:4,4'-diaponeurosporenoate glycosyltransferase